MALATAEEFMSFQPLSEADVSALRWCSESEVVLKSQASGSQERTVLYRNQNTAGTAGNVLLYPDEWVKGEKRRDDKRGVSWRVCQ